MCHENHTEKKTDSPNSERRDDRTDGDAIERFGTTLTANDGVALSCITVIGQIEGHYLLGDNQKTTKYEHILPLLAAIEENPSVDGLLVIINTVGGDVEAGLAIAEMLASMHKPTASIVIGGGHSIGIPIAVACDCSFIVPSATMTIHPVRTTGTILGVPQAFRGLEKMQKRITDFIVSHSKIPQRALDALTYRTDELATDVGAIIDGNEAVALGLIDEIGGLSSAMQYLKDEVKRNVKRDDPA
ncbi:MAG: ATP-dependent Clp protease proteolytic subunit [Clostridia bacterium]|nr:ATP-dependent Clp protease proteolytic subunit [Clostridia bacterium]